MPSAGGPCSNVIDEWEEFHKQGQAFWYDADVETYLLRNADAVTATNENLLRKMESMGAEAVRLVPNAFEDWRREEQGSRSGILPLSKRQSPTKGSITIGFFGHLTSSWINWPMIVAVARRRKDWTFEIIGYGLDKELEACENMIFLGKVEHADLPACAENWDAAMIPFQPSRLSDAVDPIKIYEYISLRLPTVVTGMPHLASYPGALIAEGDREFENAVERAARQKLDEAAVNDFLACNRWSNRIDSLLSIADDASRQSAVSRALADDRDA